jgi:hypothetical protein
MLMLNAGINADDTPPVPPAIVNLFEPHDVIFSDRSDRQNASPGTSAMLGKLGH